MAFSGGVDSSVLLALAARALGRDQVVAVLGVSGSLAAAERAGAHEVAAQLGVRLIELPTHEGEVAAYRANGPDRCFHCKQELFARIDAEVLAVHRLAAVAYGENADDMRRPDRPGARAAVEHGVLAPLAQAGVDKATVRGLARALNLPAPTSPPAPAWPHGSLTSRTSPRPSWPRWRRPRNRCAAWGSSTSGSVITGP